jgi:cytosine/uracil/thiamine/allantoin permease
LEDAKFQTVNFSAVLAWALGSFVALVGSDMIPGLHVPILSAALPALTGMVVAVVIYLLLKKFADKSRAGIA